MSCFRSAPLLLVDNSFRSKKTAWSSDGDEELIIIVVIDEFLRFFERLKDWFDF